MTESAGDEFQSRTKYRRDRMPGGGLDWASRPEVYKEYPDAEKIDLSSGTRMESARA
jgi:hypothetical protein